MKMKNEEGIKNSKKESTKHENGNQLIEFRF